MAITLISPANSTTTPLGAGATFAGTFEGVEQFAQVVVIIRADQASAADGLRFIWSNDGVTDHLTRHKFTYSASDPGREFVSPCLGAFFRLEFENGATPQGSFSLQTIYRDVAVQIPPRRLADSFDSQELALTTRTRILDIIGGVDTGNSSTTPLAGGATFTGTSREVKDNRALAVTVYADQDSAADGLSFEWSTDNSNWDLTETHTIAAGEAHSFTLAPRAQYFRVRYTNGATLQGVFRLETVAHPVAVTPDAIGNRHDLEATGDGSLIAVLKRLRTLLGGSGSLSEAIVGVTPTNLSGSIGVADTSEELAAANAARAYVELQNIGAVNVGVNPFGGTAEIGTPGTYTVYPGGSWSTAAFSRVPTTQINVVGPAGAEWTAYELETA